MKTFLPLLAVLVSLFTATPRSQAALPPKSTDFRGLIKSINDTSITVTSPKGTRTFAIYKGTVFGQRASKTLADYTVGESVIVIFSEAAGKAQAENIRNPDEDKVKAAKKKKNK
jgi:hypothetical protein